MRATWLVGVFLVSGCGASGDPASSSAAAASGAGSSGAGTAAGGLLGGGSGAAVSGGTSGNAGTSSSQGGKGGLGGSSGTSGSGGAPMTTVQPCDALPAPGSWESITPPPVAGMGSNAIALDPFDAGVVWLSAGATSPGGLYKSSDCGSTWTLVSTGENADAVNAQAFNSLVLDPIHQGTMYASVGANGGPGTGVLKSTNGGVDWVNQAPFDSEVTQVGGLINSIGMEAANPDHLVISMHDTCDAPYGPVCEAESTDAGATWTLTTVDIPGATGWVAGAGALILDANRWVFTTNDQGMWLTEDRGQTWTKVTPDGAIGATEGKTLNAPFLRRADGNYYLPSEHGVLESNDGTGWTLLPNSGGRAGALASGMDHVFTGDLWSPAYHFASFGKLDSWTEIPPPSGLKPDQGSAFLAFDAKHGVLYSSNWGDGAWRIVMPPDTR